MLYWLAKLLISISPKSKEELLNIKNDWGKQAVFSEVKKSNFKDFDYGLFINLNHTSMLFGQSNFSLKSGMLIYQPAKCISIKCLEVNYQK